MDTKFFRIPTQPNYYYGITDSEAKKVAYASAVSIRDTEPSRDNRFPGWAAPMADGRIITDYRPHCNENVPAGQQFPVKEWMQKNTDSIVELSRKRQAVRSGAIYGDDPTVVPPPTQIVQCTPTECTFLPTGSANAIGTERVYDKTPELFGTFSFPRISAPPRPTVAITTKFEGGRNSPRGRYFKDMKNMPIGKTEYLW